MSTANPKPRRVPPPCWTQDEAQSLILNYRDRWFSLGRANLKAADWDHVATTTAAAGSSSPAKTALQCRHKMEKLRKRYRSEKQRAAKCPPGRFFSSWALFPFLDEMESDPDPKTDDGGQFGVRVSLKARDLVNVDRSLSPDGVDESEVYQDSMEQFRFKTIAGENSRFYSQGGFPLKTRSNVNLKHSFNGGYGVGITSDGDYVPGGSLKRNVDFRELGAGLSGSKFVKKSGGFGVKRDVDAVEELASSIQQLGEGFVRMEKMKMEMTMEIEKRRMEMELKRHEVMLETQQQVFVDALSERKKKRKAKRYDGSMNWVEGRITIKDLNWKSGTLEVAGKENLSF